MQSNNPILQAGGALNPAKHLYIERKEIGERVFQLLREGEYCNILSSRQVGKTSLMLKTALRLKKEGIRIVSLDLSGGLGSPEKAQDWYLGFLQALTSKLPLS